MKNILILFTLILFILSVSTVSAQPIRVHEIDINSELDDFAPVFTQNSRTMFFTSERNRYNQSVYSADREGDGFANIDDVGSDVNDGDQNGSVALTPDGQYMIFAAYNHGVAGEGRTDLYSARKVDGDWEDVQNLGVAVNSGSWDSNPSLSSDGKTLFFASDRPGGFGGTDIYVTVKTREGWTKAKNLGPSVNTPSDEMTPHIAYDNKTFAFASNRSGGRGGFDIYFANINDGGVSSVSHPGGPINSPADEYFYYIIANSNVAYFASNRTGGTGGLDIYTAIPNPHPSDAVVTVHGTVRDEATNNPLGVDIIVTDLTKGKVVANLRSDDVDGTYYVVLIPGRKYSITADREEYVFYSERFEIAKAKKGYVLDKDIYLTPISNGKTRLLIFFDFNKSGLHAESTPELDRLVNFMHKYKDIRISLEGHTDDVGSNEYNDKLSLDRANTVKKFLVGHGINEFRIHTKGYGKRKPLVQGKDAKARAKNRRVEMVIVNS